MPLVLQLLGTFQVTWEDRPLKFATDSVRALLAYLVVEADIPHPRTTLATLLWPEENEATARHNLRQALVFLKKELRVVENIEQTLQITATTLQWKRQAAAVDWVAFQNVWQKSKTHHHSRVEQCGACIALFVQAIAAYRGECLHGLMLKNSQPFEEWVLLLREQTHRQATAMLDTLVAHFSASGDYEQVEQYASRHVMLEPWHEESHRQLMVALAMQGRTSDALRQYELCRRTIQQELSVPPSAETTALYEQIRMGRSDKVAGDKVTTDHLVTVSPPPPVTRAPLHNLPTNLAPLVGRSQQLTQLHRLLQDEHQRLLTIVGLGGMGKSRLALALMEALIAASPLSFDDGVWFVPLVALAPGAEMLPDRLAAAIFTAIGTASPTQEMTADLLLRYLAQRQLLLILDNFEHLLLDEACATVATEFLLGLLQAAPAVSIVITSRLPLQLLAESVIRLEGLPVPTARLTDRLDAANFESIRLFLFHAQRTLPTFRLDEANLPAIRELSEAVGGMPLAIELAAALTPHFTPQDLTMAIRQNSALLSSQRRDLNPRHRQIRAVLHSSWQLLTASEQMVLANCSIFVGHFSRGAAQSVTGATIADLTSLLDKSLIQQPAVGEYQLHQLLLQFANDALQKNPEQVLMVADRHSHYYLDFLAGRNKPISRQSPRQTAAEIQYELDNIRQAWLWTATHLTQAPSASELRHRLDRSAHTLSQFYLFACLYEEGGSAFQQAAAAVQNVLELAETSDSSTANPQAERTQWQRLLCKLRAFEALLLCFGGKHEAGQRLAKQVIAQSIGCGSRAGEVLALQGIGHVCYATGHFREAKEYFLRILASIHEAEQPAAHSERLPTEIGYSAQTMTYLYLGAIVKIDGDYLQAAAYFRQSLQLSQSLGKAMASLDARMNLADLARNKQNYAAARPDYEEVVRVAGELSNLRAEGVARYELADVLRGLGEYSEAILQFKRVLAIFGEIGDPLFETYSMSSLSACYSYLGDSAQAYNLLQQAIQKSKDIAMPDAKSSVWLAMSVYYHLTGDDAQALHFATHCLEHERAHQNRHGEAIALLHAGFALEGLQRWEEAKDAYQTAMQSFQRLEIQPALAEAVAGLARLAMTTGDRLTAQGWVEEILAILPVQTNIGLDEPFLIYLTCYNTLQSNADLRATSILQTGVQELQRYAEQIRDSALRRSFLEKVTSHRLLCEAASGK